jgi:hypothetical protein
MQAKNVLGHSQIHRSSAREAVHRFQAVPWKTVAVVSLAASIGNGWAAIVRQSRTPSPFMSALTMMLAVFAGWYAWAFFAHLVDKAFFGGHARYSDFLSAFSRAYAFQALSFFAFTHTLGFMWVSVAFFLTIVAWGIVGPRRLGMRTGQAVIAATLGMLVWLACLALLSLTVTWDGLCVGIGAFLV